jgi:hypothetical protein
MNNRSLVLIPRLLLLLLAVATLESCKPTRVATPVTEAHLMTPDRLVLAMHNNHATFEHFSSRFSGNALIDNQNYNVSGSIRIHKDEAIFVSIAPLLGIEVARALITPDTVKFVNRLEGSYFVGDMRFINSMLNTDLDFYMLQAILLGNDFEHFTAHNFQVMEDRGRLMLHSPSRGRSGAGFAATAMQHNLWLDDESFRIRQALLYDPGRNRSIRAEYHDFSTIDGQLIPSNISLTFTEPMGKAEISIRYNRTTLNVPQQMSFSIPSRYTPMDF